MRDIIGLSFVIAVTAGLSGCGGAAGGDPGAKALPMGQSCQSIRSDLDRLLSRGVQPLVEKASNGGKLTPSQKVDADTYNRLLNDYLGARCHA